MEDESCEPQFDRSYSARIAFSYKSPWQHFIEVFEKPVDVLRNCLSVLGGISLLLWLPASFFGLEVVGWFPCLIVICVSVAVGLIWRVIEYRNTVPEGFALRNKTACYFAHMRPLKWEYKLAQSLLAESKPA